ncbi:MAG: laminin G [Opitutaceae bacterium]|jgi:hypothetical protein|nr:laminin G [Opitutaceae bacterium]
MNATRLSLLTLCGLVAGTFFPKNPALAGEVSGKPVVWSHYTPWHTPLNASISVRDYYNYPLFRSTGDDQADWAEEYRRAKAQGIDGFFVDVVFSKSGRETAYSTALHRMLKAAEGGDFEIALCLDVKTTVEHQVRELARMLSLFGEHPNYPRHGGKPVVATYTWGAWTPDEWAAIRAGLLAAGHDIYLIANVGHSYTKQDRKWLDSYAPHFDMAYCFGFRGLDGTPRRQTARLVADVAQKYGKAYMAGLSPCYYGAWLNGRNDFYQPHRGFDQLHDSFLLLSEKHIRWLHFTTWNDHDETSVLPMLFTPANPLITRAYGNAFKGIAPTSIRPEVCLAYHREEIPGTLLRIEALNLPSLAKGPARVSGKLLDPRGKTAALLESRALATGEFARTEWLVPTAPLAHLPALTPEITVSSPGFSRTAKLLPVLLVNGWHQNAVTIKTPFSRHIGFPDTLAVRTRADAGEDSRVDAEITFDAGNAGEEIASATLFRNDRPLAAFNALTHDKTLLNLYFDGAADWTLTIAEGELLNAVRKFAEKDSTDFTWSRTGATSRHAKTWTPAGVLCAVSSATRLTFAIAGNEPLTLAARELNERGIIRRGNLTIDVSPVDVTVQNHAPLARKAGRFRMSILTREPHLSDMFFVRYETIGGRVALSGIVYPFAPKPRHPPANLVQTSINLETTSGATGMPGENEYLTPREKIPLATPSVIKTRIPAESVRAGRWTFDGTGRDSLGDMPVSIAPDLFAPADDGDGMVLRLDGKNPIKMRLRTWPIGNATVDFRLNPEPGATARQSVIGRTGWSDAININLLPDGRVEIVRDGNETVPVEKLVSQTPLPFGQWSRLRITNDSTCIRIYINNRLDAETLIRPARSYGNSTWFVGGGYKGYANYRGKIDDLTVCGAAFAPGAPDFPGENGIR